MNGKIMKITKVEIKGLWNRFDLSWDLHPDVNVLSGINGSGKSTIKIQHDKYIYHSN